MCWLESSAFNQLDGIALFVTVLIPPETVLSFGNSSRRDKKFMLGRAEYIIKILFMSRY
jgi:hypothetical protein